MQDDTQSLEKEVEETHRIGKYNEGNIRLLKVRMRSQLAVEQIDCLKPKNIRIFG